MPIRSVDEYREELRMLGVSDMTIRASSLKEAKSEIARVRAIEKNLRNLKRSIAFDMKSIRQQLRQQLTAVGSGRQLFASLIGAKGLGRSMRASAKESLREKCEVELMPYEKLKNGIDDLLNQSAQAKFQLQQYIEELNTTENKVSNS